VATRDAVFDRFVGCCRRAAKKQCGWPRLHNRLERIAIIHRFAGGGRAVNKLNITKKRLGWRFGLKPVSDWAYEGKTRRHTNRRLSAGVFGLSKETKLDFQTVLHRQLPFDSVVKTVSWLGRLHPIRGWQWAIAITTRVDSPSVETEPLPACGIDFGWRAKREYVRVGMLRDCDGNVVELRLPFDAPTSKTRRNHLASSYFDLVKIDRETDNKKNDAKARLGNLTDLPDDFQKRIAELAGVRQAGLAHPLSAMEASNSASKVQEILCQWRSENNRLSSIRAALQDRLIGRRRWFYRNIGSFLTRKYRTIALEDEFAAKEMIEDRMTKDRDLPFQRSIRHYQWAAVAELRTYIIEAAVKNGVRIVKTDTKGSTTTCFICGRYTEHQPNLRLTCPSGHTWDQDVNAASNILSGIEGLAKIENSGTPNLALVIPDSLTRVMVPIA
jgi:hypothetical protein